MQNHHETCGLCQSPSRLIENVKFKNRTYYKCDHCLLIQANMESRPSAKMEKERYDKHQNDHSNQGYLSYLQQIVDATLPYLKPNMNGIDFGCGPNPILSEIMSSHGYKCDQYDPFYFPKLPDKTFDFVLASECFEHFFRPIQDINLILTILKPNGFLGIMTEMWHDESRWQEWYYIRDLTHVSFFHQKTFDYLCEKYGLTLVYSDFKRCVVLQKHS